jgi:hypothetical protein
MLDPNRTYLSLTSLWTTIIPLWMCHVPIPATNVFSLTNEIGTVAKAPQLFWITFFGAIFADILAITSALRSGKITVKRWTKPLTYVGMATQGLVAGLLRAFVLNQFSDPLSAFSIGVNLPLILEKFAALAPNLAVPATPREPGFANEEVSAKTGVLEQIRRYLAKEE